MAGKKEQPAAAPAATGKTEYVALKDLDFPDGAENVKRALAGEVGKVSKWCHLKAGDKSTQIPAVDITWLLREKFIKAVSD